MFRNFSLTHPKSVEEATALLARKPARILAGGSDLLGCLRDGVFETDTVMSLSKLEDLRGVTEIAGGGLRIGALTTIADIAAHPAVVERFTCLADAASAVASPQLRNQGTLGGNLCQKPRCWYYRGEFHCLRKGGEECFAFDGDNRHHCVFGGESCYHVHPSDAAPALVALDAVARVAGPAGRSLAVESLHVSPAEDPQRETALADGEILTHVMLPPPPDGLRSSYRKVRSRGAWDFALAGTALALAFDGNRVTRARVVFSGVAPVPWRSAAVEGILTGKVLDGDLIAKAAGAAVEGAEALAHNAYKIPLLRGLVTEQLEAMVT